MKHKYVGGTSLGNIFNKIKGLFDGLSTVAKSGSYNDLVDTPKFSKHVFTITSDNTSYVTLPETLNSEDRLLVYYNGLLTNRDINYTVDLDENRVVLLGYSAHINDIITVIMF